IHAIEWAAGTRAIVLGKPSLEFFAQVVASTPFAAGRCLMIGDDAVSDVKAAIDAGLQACLVKTGKYQPGDETDLPVQARVIENVTELFAKQVIASV
ncbi:MAG: HAD hydrolase-like protein, partial [Gammaproteobacteria bacterium]|nr:HAD hydrolase-like protein [Gammaproteobacteria bacterium]